jgi:phosphoserine phosphatase
MDYRLVLSAALGQLRDDVVEKIVELVGHPPHWLSAGTACEFRTEGPETLTEKARALLSGHAVDVNSVPAQNRRKKLLLADMDSTIIGCECLDELADFAGLKPQIAAITERAMRGEIEFESSLRERVALLKGMPASILQRAYDERVTVNIGARSLVRTMEEADATTMLISGGFSFFSARVASDVGFGGQQANELLVVDGKLTGQVREPILGRSAKREALHLLVLESGITLADAIAIGDGANDLGMIADAGLGIAYRAKPVVAAAAGARLDHSDLEAVLYLQGYRDDEIIRD